MGRTKRSRKPSTPASSDTPAVSVDLSEVVKELDAVKRLLILLLAKLGADSPEISMALGVGQSTVREMLQFRRVNKIWLPEDPDE